jgi:hypothetical protein
MQYFSGQLVRGLLDQTYADIPDIMVALDTRRLIDSVFQGPKRLKETLEREGYGPISDDLVRKWWERDSVPAPWLAVMIVLSQKRRVLRFDVNDFLAGEQTWESKQKRVPTGGSQGIFD